ncbi:MAG: hypothetical protein K9L17_04620 [Clostridiales bacterium]|nr:hypothetical protein [Clostridiales bacterium]MCF8021959.1 hypothetical protein [Clostridiales bacterium]
MNTLQPYNFSAPIQGVKVKPMSEDGTMVKIRYDGLLHNSGAENVLLYAGFGDVNNWENIKELPMQLISTGWEQSLQMEENQLNFCFKDHVGNWDNNNGMNWIYRIS